MLARRLQRQERPRLPNRFAKSEQGPRKQSMSMWVALMSHVKVHVYGIDPNLGEGSPVNVSLSALSSSRRRRHNRL